jgi:hypothetical protein
MPYQAIVYNVFLASPGDVAAEREIARKLILDWNNIHAFTRKIILLPIGWEHNTTPSTGDRPQEIINKQILEDADLLVGIFWTRVGTPTGKAVSGSVEEIEEHIASGKPAMLYFSSKPIDPNKIEQDQLEGVKKLKREYQSKALTETFDSVEDFAAKFQRHLALKVNQDPYFQSANSEEFFSGSEPIAEDSIRHELSVESRSLLLAAATSASGEIVRVGYIGGYTVQANGRQFNEDYSPRTKAKWEQAIQDLLGAELIKEVGYKGEIFRVTDLGFRVADKIDA